MADKLIGQNYTTPDLEAKVTGKAKYAEDFRADGMLFTKLLLSPMPHARVTYIDKEGVLAMPGVKAILTADDLPDLTGAEKALRSGKSLLPVGVKAVTGAFERGDAVVLKSEDGRELGRGLVAYDAADARSLVGRRTVEIEAILGYRGRDEMIHRDWLALTAFGGETA